VAGWPCGRVAGPCTSITFMLDAHGPSPASIGIEVVRPLAGLGPWHPSTTLNPRPPTFRSSTHYPAPATPPCVHRLVFSQSSGVTWPSGNRGRAGLKEGRALMAVNVQCPGCFSAVSVPQEKLGGKVKCRTCGHVFVAKGGESSSGAKGARSGGKGSSGRSKRSKAGSSNQLGSRRDCVERRRSAEGAA